jgi:cytidylate kinase
VDVQQSQQQPAVADMRVITISREYGSGGGEIAARLAQQLGWELGDHAVVERMAQELGIAPEEAEARDEHVEGLVVRMLAALQVVGPVPVELAPTAEVENRAHRAAMERIFQAAVAAGHAVMVGRGGQVILRGRRDTLHVRVVAPFAERVTYVARREALDERAARSRVQAKDHDRARYMQTIFQCHNEDPHLYDVVVNTGYLGLDGAVDVIVRALECRARLLHAPESALGPAAGMGRYPGVANQENT